MRYKYISSHEVKIHVHSLRGHPHIQKCTDVNTKCDVILAAPDRVNIPCLIHDTDL